MNKKKLAEACDPELILLRLTEHKLRDQEKNLLAHIALLSHRLSNVEEAVRDLTTKKFIVGLRRLLDELE